MSSTKRFAVAALGLVVGLGLSLTTPALAVTLNFDSSAASTNLGGTPNNPASVLTTNLATSSGIVFGFAGTSAGVAVVANTSAAFSDPNAVSGLDANGDLVPNLAGDIYFHFVDPSNTSALGVTDLLSFLIGDDGGDLDSWIIRAYDIHDTIINTQSLSGASHQTYTLSLAGIHRIWIQNTTGTTFGFAVDDLSFDLPVGVGGDGQVPEPATLLLLAAGLGALIVRGRRL